MAVWDELKVIVLRLRDDQPSPLMSYPMPDVDEGRQPPFKIRLAPWATATAEDLHHRFGDDVTLTVGALPYPPGSGAQGPRMQDQPAELFHPRQVVARLDGEAIVKSGQTMHHGLLLTNRTHQPLQIATNGRLTATVVDPATGEVVGGFAGAQTLALIWFHVAPAASQRIPLLIGTASFTPSLGYAVSPGAWGVQTTLTLGDYPSNSYYRRTPVLPLTVTA